MNHLKFRSWSILILSICFSLILTLYGETIMQSNEKAIIKSIIDKAYIEGIHTTQEESSIRIGFHKDFTMLVYNEAGLEEVKMDKWLKRIEKMKKANPDLWSKKTRYDSLDISVAGYAASVQLNVYKGDTFFSTDYMLLYKFEDGWKIVSKIFTTSRDESH